ncbi:BTAD domain-containing putative transcriptional regulator [Actinomadura sp. 6K520]|uniref:ATP-binding protein n=1 Tax=Actinomadura sp. 6K520 TaxID=2530364 RepID=UPI00140487FC|nr:BTAD domain-containing putative transcriptional regulator [Actinomadura sp. 6K520]
MVDLRFGVLGPLEVRRDGTPVDVPSGRRRAVLACLLTRVGRPVPADALVEAAWAGELPADPRSALRTVLSRLRAVLGTGVIRADATGYILDVPAETVDAHRFECLSRRAEQTPQDAARLLDDALALWRGPAYAEFADRGFAEFEAQSLDRMRRDALEARASAALAAGDPRAAAARLESLLAEQPFREYAVELLLTALYAMGDHTGALARFREYRARLAAELGLDPAPALRELESRILAHDLARPPRRHRPAPDTPPWVDTSTAFVGRDSTLAELVDAVADCRLVTVTGVGGVGKTRAVAEAVPLLAERLGTPVTVVQLAPVPADRVDAAAAEALGLHRSPGSARTAVIEHLRVSPGVLVLDNCEHVRAEAAALAGAVATRCPSARVLATSRHRLGTPSERLVPLEPLPTPDALADPDRMDLAASVRVLTDRVRRLRSSFGVTRDNVAVAADICRRLDGLPLALELAASRIAVLGLEPVRDRLAAEDLTLLDGHGPGNLHAVIDWSYRLLTPAQRDLLALLAVFPADFDPDAVAGLTAACPRWERPVTGDLGALVESSLLATHPADRDVRYRMLAVVRAFAAARLRDTGGETAAKRAYVRWVRRWTERAAADCAGPASVEAFARLRHRRADIQQALRWAVDAADTTDAARLAAAVQLCQHWQPGSETFDLTARLAERCPESALAVAAGACAVTHAGDTARGRALAEAALTSATTPHERYLAHLALGIAAMYRGDHDESARCWRAITGMNDIAPAYRASAHSSLSLTSCYRGDLAAARREAEIGVLGAETAGATAVHAFALYALGEAETGDRKTELLAAAAQKAELVGAAHVGQVARVARLAALVRAGRHDEAVDLLTPLLDGTRRAGTWPQLWTTMRIFAELLAARDHPHEAALLLTGADAADTAPPPTGTDIARYAALTKTLHARLGEETVTGIASLSRDIPPSQLAERARAMATHLLPTH